MTRSRAHWILLPLMAGCSLGTGPCKYLCEYNVECVIERYDDYGQDCEWDDESDVADACMDACVDEWKKLDGDDKKEVDACIKCLEDEIGGDCDGEDWYEAYSDDCEDECDDNDVEDFYEDFYDEWDAGDDLECGDDNPYTTRDTGYTPYYGDDDDDDDTTSGEIIVTVNWTDDGFNPTDTNGDSFPDVGCNDSVQVLISDPLGETSWSIAIAETGSPNGWYGEDCYVGYAGFNYCHDIGINSVLNEVSDCSVLSIVEGSTTYFDASKDPFVTYYLEDSLGNCFVWGHDTSYYSPLACIEM